MTKINNHKDFLTGAICSTAGVDLDAELIKDCSEEVIELAKQLKANNLTGVGGDREKSKKYSEKKPLTAQSQDAYDQFFISYAERMLEREFKTRYDVIYKQRAMNCDINDPQWAGYSADEILAMEQNGTVIPKDVIEWAHSQQQLDVTNYVLETDSDSEDATIADNLTDTDSLSVLQATAKKNIQKVEKAAEKIKDKQTKYEKIADDAAQLKKTKENTFNKKIEEVKSLKEEWEELKTKKDNGKLSFLEQQKFNKLSKDLKKSGKVLDNEMNFGSNELEDFLDELDGINSEIKTNSQIAKDAIDAGRALNDVDKSYDAEALPYAYTGTTLDNSGLVSASLNGLTNEEIGEMAIEKGAELDKNTNTLEGNVNSSTNTETKEFALNFTTEVQNTEATAKNVTTDSSVENNEDNGENKEEQEQKDEANDIQEKSRQLEYGILSANKATVKTLASSAENLAKGTTVTLNDKSLNKELKTASKKMQTITKEVEEVNKRLTDNEMSTENFLQELESLQAESSDDGEIQASSISTQSATQQTASTTQPQVQNNETSQAGIIEKDGNSEFTKATEKGMTVINAFETADKIVSSERKNQPEEEATDPEHAAELAHKAEIRAKKINLAEKIQDLGADKEIIATDLKTAIDQGDNATKKGIKILGTLDKNNEKLEQQNEKATQDANDAVDIGIGTYALGTGTVVTGLAQHAYGTALMSNPWTFSTGLALSILGQATVVYGHTEQAAGLISAASGTQGKIISTEENSVISNAIGTMTKAESVLNVNVLSLDQANDTAKESETTDSTNNNAEQTTTETQNIDTQNLEQDGILTGLATPLDENLDQATLLNPELATTENTTLQNQPQSLIAGAINNNVNQQPQDNQIQPTQNTSQNRENNTQVNQENSAPQTENNNTEKTQEAALNNNEQQNETSTKEDANEVDQNTQTTENETDGKSTDEVKQESEQAQNQATTEQVNAETSAATENQETQNNKDEASKTSDSKKSNEKKEVTEKDAESAVKESKKGQQEMTAAQKEDKQNQKEVKKMSKQIKDINKSTKSEEQHFKKQMQNEQKQLEKKNQELEAKQAKLEEQQAQQLETQAEIESLTQALSTAKESRKPELQAQIQASNVKLTDKSAEIAALSKEVSTITTYGTKKRQNLKRSTQSYIKIAKARQKTSKKAEKTADKIYKIADTTSQVAGLVATAGNITSKIGNAVTTAGTALVNAGTLQINFWTPLLSTPWSAGTAAAMIAQATATQVVPGTAQIATGTTTSVVGESVALAANLTNVAASLTKAGVSIEQGNIAGAIMATGSAIMSGVSAGQNLSQIGQLNETAAAAQGVQSAAQNASANAANEVTSAGGTVAVDEGVKEQVLNGSLKADESITSAAGKSINESMNVAMEGTKDAAGKTVTKGFTEASKNFAKSSKFGIDDVMQIGGTLQTMGSMLGSSQDGTENTKKDRRMKRFGSITRIDAKKRTRKVNATAATASHSGSSNNSAK